MMGEAITHLDFDDSLDDYTYLYLSYSANEGIGLILL